MSYAGSTRDVEMQGHPTVGASVKVLEGLEAIHPPFVGCVLTIGNFDGVHRAHQQLLAQAGLFAADTGGPVVVLTFEPHPLSVVGPRQSPPRLSLLEGKLIALGRAGADLTVVARSEPELLHLEAEQFVEEIIRKKFQPTHIVEGPSFGFGKERKGTPELLKELAGGFGCTVHIVEPVTFQIGEGEELLVSSSLIRYLVADGKVRRAALCLGRNYTIVGDVIRGATRGRTIGVPTANLLTHDQLIPGDGVYAGQATVRGTTHRCAISIGVKQTFGGTERCVEAHLLDFDGNLYGERIELEFSRRIREQQTFPSAEALATQLAEDVRHVRDEMPEP